MTNHSICVIISLAEYAERAYLNSKHRLGCPPRVKIEDEKISMRIVNLFTFHYYLLLQLADVAELADALVSGSSEAIHVGSSPVVRTT